MKLNRILKNLSAPQKIERPVQLVGLDCLLNTKHAIKLNNCIWLARNVFLPKRLSMRELQLNKIYSCHVLLTHFLHQYDRVQI